MLLKLLTLNKCFKIFYFLKYKEFLLSINVGCVGKTNALISGSKIGTGVDIMVFDNLFVLLSLFETKLSLFSNQ